MSLKNVRFSLRNKLIVMIIAIVIAALMSQGAVTINLSEKALESAVNEKLLAVANDVCHQVQGVNNAQFTALRVLADLGAISDEDVSLVEKKNMLSEASARMGDMYENIGYYDKDGNTITFDGRMVNLKDREYCKQTMRGNDVIIDPVYSEIMGGVMMNYGVPVRNTSGGIIGSLVMIMRGNPMIELIKKIDLGGGMHPAIMNRKTGETIANVNEGTNDNGTNIRDIDTTQGLGLVLSNLMSGKTGTATFTDPFIHKKITSSYMPIDGTDWSVFCAAPYDVYFGHLARLKLVVTIILVVSIIVAALLSGIMVTVLIRPLHQVRNAIKDIASGNADLTRRLPNTYNDEIGDVVTGFNGFVEKLQEIITSIKGSGSELKIVDEDLQSSTQDASATITQIIGNIESVDSQILAQAQSVSETAGAVNEISSNIESLERMIESQSRGVTEASAAVEQMIGNINSVNSAVEKMVGSFTLLEQNTNAGISTQSNANEKIKEIEEESKMLQDANAAISNIAEQTNLLAMNAAIEAAHAGEAGKGFSVVADEIRKLSETSSAQSKTIGEELNRIQDKIEEVVAASGDTNAAFSSVSQSINDTNQIIQQIKAAMEEQQIGSKQIIEALQSMNNSTSEVKSASQEMTAGNAQILKEINKLQSATDIIKNSVHDMQYGATKVNETGNALTGISGKVTESIKKIGDQVDLFKV